MRIGVDVGGTNSDAVLMDAEKQILSWYKAPTTDDISSGVMQAISGVIDQSAIDPKDITRVSIGTTQFTNAFVQRQGLLEVAVVRLASPSGLSVRPKIGWPKDLAARVGDHNYFLPGGYEYDGREIAAFDEAKLREVALDIAGKGLRAVAISSPFAQVNKAMELRAAEIIRDENPSIAITLSSDIGRLGLLERENSAIINASLADLSKRVVEAFHNALGGLGIEAPLYITQNDGTLMSAETIERFPVYTFASGPTNSIRGAAFLTGLDDAVVVDIGGTTCDIGVLKNGFARQSSLAVDIGGLHTNFRMPDILSLPLGGGTHIRSLDYRADSVRVGPDSVGLQLDTVSLVFGGDRLTATDIAVAANPALELGDRSLVSAIPPAFVEHVNELNHQLCEDGIDRMKTSCKPVPIILVGGGSVLINRPLVGTSEIVMPEYASVANAIGAAIAQIGAEVEQLYTYQSTSRRKALAKSKAEAIAAVKALGGCDRRARVVDIEEIAINYLPGDVYRVKVKAMSELRE